MREMTTLSVVLRLVVAFICGGLIGIEREYKRRPAGFRTHILICLGAAMTTLTSQYLYITMQMFTDVARLGAQVIAGIGFIGAGTIIVTRQRRVKGLTTAAGMWTAAIIGLACGAGYVECALFATLLVLLAELLLIKLEYRVSSTTREMNLYVEYAEAANLDDILHRLRE
jgi:putative Mg2+ transporter-C (MgtC) family protein